MSHRNQHRVCAYCGKDKKLTVDHVPPKLLLAKPYPPNLITVPACWGCNKSFQKDDEYTRVVVARDFRAGNNPDAQAKLPAIIRSLERSNASSFAEYLANRTANTTILDMDGQPMGEVIDVDHARVNATGARMIRALHFLETGSPVSEGARINVAAKPGLRSDDPAVLQVARLYHGIQQRCHREIGTAFSYVACFGTGFSVWLMLLYDYFFWCGTVDVRRP